MFLFNRVTVAVALAFSAPSTILADTINEDEVERIEVYGKLSHYSATKSDTPIMETSRSVSIEDLEQLTIKGALHLDDALTYSAGVAGQTYGFATRGDWVKVRGLTVPQYQDSLQSLFGHYNNTRPDIYTLEQVEILKGPASVLYGKGSPGGLVNVVSKTPKTESAHEIVLELGNFDRKQLAIDSTGAIDSEENWLYRFVSVYRDTDTQVDFVDDKTVVLAPSITWMPSPDTELTLLVNYTDTDSDTGAQFLPLHGTLLPAANGKKIKSSVYAGQPGFNHYKAETLAITLMAEHQLNADWSLSATSRFTDAEADYQQAWTTFIPGRWVYNADGSLYKDGTVPRTFYRNDATSEQKAIDVRLRGEFTLGAFEHKVLIGTQYQDVTTGSAGYYAYAPGLDFTTGMPDQITGDLTWLNLFNPVYADFDPDAMLKDFYTKNPYTDAKDLGIYISDQIDYADWSLTLGARFDDSESETSGKKQSDEEVSLSVGLLYSFANGMAPYVNYAESFDPVIGDNGNGELLKPQFGEQVEVGLKYVPTNFPGFFTVAWFDIEQTNLPDPASLPGQFEQQRGKATIDGVEFEGLATVGDFTIELNASKLNTKSADGFHLASIPEKQASTWVTYTPADKLPGFRAGFGLRYNGESWGGVDKYRTPSYTIADLMLGYQTGNWDFALNIRNLSDKSYYASCLSRGDCFPGKERTVIGRIKYQF